MPYLIVALIIVGAVIFFVLKKKKEAAPPPATHQANFQGIFPSQYGGGTYEMSQAAGVVLFGTQGAVQGKELPLPVGASIGGDPKAQVALPNEESSALLSQENGQYILRSTNGKPFSHNEQSTTEAKLASGDTLTFGKNVLKVQVN